MPVLSLTVHLFGAEVAVTDISVSGAFPVRPHPAGAPFPALQPCPSDPSPR